MYASLFLRKVGIFMQNKLTDLNNHLFTQMERLNDEDLDVEQLNTEIKRAKAMSSIASNIINNAALNLEACKYIDEFGGRKNVTVPEMVLIEEKK